MVPGKFPGPGIPVTVGQRPTVLVLGVGGG